MTAARLTFRVADSLTGKLVGVLRPSSWTFDDPLTGFGKGELTVPLPSGSDDVARLVELTRPHDRQVCVHDEQDRWWFGGPVVAEPTMADRQVTVTFADWRAWFYAAALDADYISVGEEQVVSMTALAATRVGDPGAPRLTIDSAATSDILRNVAVRQTTMLGVALDDIARRDSGPDWWTYLQTDPDDPTSVIARLTFAYPERTKNYGLYLRHRLGRGGNLLDFEWPDGNVPASRVIGIHGTAPDQLVVTTADPAVADGETLAWDEVYSLPDGVDADTAFEYTYARLASRTNDGTITGTIDPAATDLGAWGPGERARLSIDDGWRAIESTSARVLGRTLAGRAGAVTSVKVQISVTEPEPDIPVPTPVVI